MNKAGILAQKVKGSLQEKKKNREEKSQKSRFLLFSEKLQKSRLLLFNVMEKLNLREKKL